VQSQQQHGAARALSGAAERPNTAAACRRRLTPPAAASLPCRAVVFNRLVGIKDEVYEEGTHFMVPWFERPIIYDVRARPNVITSTSGSRDLQMVGAAPGLGCAGLVLAWAVLRRGWAGLGQARGWWWAGQRVLPVCMRECLEGLHVLRAEVPPVQKGMRSWVANERQCRRLSTPALLLLPRCPLQVNIGLRVLTRPMPSKLPEIYRTLGSDYAGGRVCRGGNVDAGATQPRWWAKQRETGSERR
jgi:hypothetical protein